MSLKEPNNVRAFSPSQFRVGFLLVLLGGLSSLVVAQEDTDSIDLTTGWRFQPAAALDDFSTQPADPDLDDSSWKILRAGARWEDQGFPELDGSGWYRQQVEIPDSWRGQHVWLSIGALNDEGTIYCNGVRINRFGKKGDVKSASMLVVADLTGAIEFGEKNLIAVEVVDRGGSGGIWCTPCLATTDAVKLPLEDILLTHVDEESGALTVDFSLLPLGMKRPRITLEVSVSHVDSEEPIAQKSQLVPPTADAATITLALPKSTEDLRVHTRLVTESGDPYAGMEPTRNIDRTNEWSWPGEYASLRVLNNLVTELANTSIETKQPVPVRFLNPRKGWVFMSVLPDTRTKQTVRGTLDDAGNEILWRKNNDSGALEAMQLLEEGAHVLTLTSDESSSVHVRAIPELSYCYYPAIPHIKAYGEYDWAFVNRHVLSHVNTLIASGDIQPDHFEHWAREGRKWLSNSSLLGLKDEEAPREDDVYETWVKNRGYTQLGFSGIVVDEFMWQGPAHFASWEGAFQRLASQPSSRDRTFHAWCLDIFGHSQGLEFARAIQRYNGRFAWEKYQHEAPTLAGARRSIHRDITSPMVRWKQLMPGVENNMVITLGYLSAPPETLNLNPGVDYHTFLDIQFQVLANDSAFERLAGIMEYSSRYADEESLRFAHKLFRHYAIEGNRSRYTQDPYILPHLSNPDFADGLSGWNVESATEGSVSIAAMEGFSYLQGRFPRVPEGDQFCQMTRNQDRPNRIVQVIEGLTPGRTYSVKAIAADLTDFDQPHGVGISIQIDGADILPQYNFAYVYPSIYDHEIPPYGKDHPAHFTFHRLVFKPTGTTAKLVISDWSPEGAPAGPIDHDIAVNFIEVQPFHAP